MIHKRKPKNLLRLRQSGTGSFIRHRPCFLFHRPLNRPTKPERQRESGLPGSGGNLGVSRHTLETLDDRPDPPAKGLAMTTTQFGNRMAAGAPGPRIRPLPVPEHSSGRSSQALMAIWITVAVVSGVAIIISAPGLAGWMLLPAIPAGLLWWARRRDGSTSRCDHAVMRIFSIATFVAIISQLVASVTSLWPLLVVAAAVILFLLSVEQLASLRSK